MRRLLLLLALAPLAAPLPVSAQPRFLVGAGLSAPNGDLSQTADAGYHGQVGLSLGIPTLPISVRADGTLHRMAAAVPTSERTKVLAGTLSLVYTMPGVGMTPYLLAGMGSFRTETGPAGAAVTETSRGYHGGFGVNVGAAGMAFFSEIRFVQIDTADRKLRLVPFTVGLRL